MLAACGEVSVHIRRHGPLEVDHATAQRSGAAPGPVVTGEYPDVARFRLAAPGIKDGNGGLVAEQLRRCLQFANQVSVQRLQLSRCTADPIGQRRTVNLDALARHDLGLAIKCCARDYALPLL